MKALFDLRGIITVLNTPFTADNGIDVDGLSDAELHACYEAAWRVAAIWRAKRSIDSAYAVGRKQIQESIAEHLGLLDEVMGGTETPEGFAEAVIETAEHRPA